MTVKGVIKTSTDSVASKWSAVAKSYFKYDELEYFVPPGERVIRQPLINRGYYTRVRSIRKAVTSFLEVATTDCQIVNFGCGLDPLYYWICEEATGGKLDAAHPRIVYYEVDYKDVLQQKAQIIQKVPELSLRAGLPAAARSQTDLITSNTYHMISHDFNDITDNLKHKLIAQSFNPKLPTCFIIECVTTYLTDQSADHLLRLASTLCDDYVITTYDLFNVRDRFGQVMQRNLARRSCEILSTSRFQTTDDVTNHFLSLLTNEDDAPPFVQVINMNEYYTKYTPPIEKFRIEQLELFDELEEWRLIQEHYFVSYVTNMSELMRKGHQNQHGSDGVTVRSERGTEFVLECSSGVGGRPRFNTEDLRECQRGDLLTRAVELIYSEDEDPSEMENAAASIHLLRCAGFQEWLHTPNSLSKYYSAPSLALQDPPPPPYAGAETTPTHNKRHQSTNSARRGTQTTPFAPLLQAVDETAEPTTTIGQFLQGR